MTRRRALLLVAAVLPALAARASAHGFLERSDPRANSIVKRPPDRVRLWFTGAIEPAYRRVEVLTELGQRVDVGESIVDPETRKSLTVAVPPLPPGRYQVKWRVLSVDTHVTEGSFSFRIAP
ncbi:MAG: copper resistance CopC family protein [Candidatus Rokuibacteriota bacterium]